MPAPPEIGDAAAQIRIAEILREAEAQHPAEADGHVGIAAEVKIELQRVPDQPQPRGQHRQRSKIAPDPRDQPRQRVGQQRLFRQPDGEAEATIRHVLYAGRALRQCRLQLMIRHDRAHDQLREQGQIQPQAQEVFLRGRLLPVDVDEIADRVEGIERHAERQMQLRQIDKSAKEEPGVLDRDQQPQLEDQPQNQQPPPPPCAGLRPHRPAEQPGNENGREQQQDPLRLAPRIEEQTPGQQDDVFRPRGDQIVDNEKERKKVKQKTDAAERHRQSLPNKNRRILHYFNSPGRGCQYNPARSAKAKKSPPDGGDF